MYHFLHKMWPLVLLDFVEGAVVTVGCLLPLRMLNAGFLLPFDICYQVSPTEPLSEVSSLEWSLRRPL